MCVSDECKHGEITPEGIERRAFLTSATAAIIGITLGSDAAGQQTAQPPSNALNDTDIVQGMVSFKSGAATIEGYQARPKAAGKYRAVVLMHGDFGLPEIDRYTAAVLAQNGFVSLAIKRFSRYPKLTIQDIIKSDRTDRRYLSKAFNEEELQDAQAAIDYLKEQSFVKHKKRVGIVGFCGGGVQGLWLATKSKDVKAVVTLYALTEISEQYQDPNDPKPSLMELVKQIKVPVQAHYGADDHLTPPEDVKKFEQALKAQNIPINIFFYKGAKHAFCDYARANYNPEACTLAMRRTLEFLKTRLR
jgi:carboxymethylenebutenolidase